MKFEDHYIDKCRNCPHFRHVGTMAFGRDDEDKKTWQTETSYYCKLNTTCDDRRCLLYGTVPRIDRLEAENAQLKTKVEGLEATILDVKTKKTKLSTKVERLEKEIFDAKTD